MKYKKNLTVIIVTYKTSDKILLNCIKSIDKKVKIKIIENSQNFENKKLLEKKFPNLKVHCTGKNLGYGGGNNFGFKLSKTDYALVLNPDAVCDGKFFENIKRYIDRKLDFTVIGTRLKKKSVFKSYGFFDEKNKIEYSIGLDKKDNYLAIDKVDWVVGCGMLINLKKFKSSKIFDENFFLYFEEFDLCKRLKTKGENVYSSKLLLIDHLGFKGSFASNQKLILEAEYLRSWHLMWSSFYFYKKNYSYIFALKKTSGKLIRSIIKYLFYVFCFNKKESNNYKSRFLGLFNSIIGKKSWERLGHN